MEDKRRAPPGRRLIQLALNDAVQSRLCVVSPIKARMEREKKERRKVNKITIWTESNSCNSSHGPDVLVRESTNGFGISNPVAKWNCPWNKSLPDSRNQSEHLPSLRQVFQDEYKSKSFSQCMKSNYNSIAPFNASNFGSKNALCSTTLSKTANTISTFAASDCNRRDVESNSAFLGFNGNNANALPPQVSFNSHPVSTSYECTEENFPSKQTQTGLSSNSSYDLPMLSQSCESNWFEGSKMSGTPWDEEHEIPKMSSDLKHLTLHSVENSLRPEKELLSDFIRPPTDRSHWFDAEEQNDFSKNIKIPAPLEMCASSQLEIPAPTDLTGPICSPKLNSVLPVEEPFNDNPYSAKKPRDRDIENNQEHPLKSNPHFSTLKHFEGLIYENPEALSSFITVITDDLELKIVSNPSHLDAEHPISKPKGVNADYLVDSFIHSDAKPRRDETTTSNLASGGITFDNKLYPTNTDDIFYVPEGKKTLTPVFESDYEKNIQGKVPGGLCSNSFSQRFSTYDAPLSNINPKVSMSIPHINNNLSSYEEFIYPVSNRCSSSCRSIPSPPLPQFRTVDRKGSSNPESRSPKSTINDYSLIHLDVSKDKMSSSESGNMSFTQNHSCNSFSDCDKTNSMSSPFKTSKLQKSVEVLNSSNFEESFRSDFNEEDSASQYGGEALKSKTLEKASGSLDSGIGLTSDERECDSVWNLL